MRQLKQMGLPFERDIKVGDRVKIVGKSVGDRLGEGMFGAQFYCGAVGEITKINIVTEDTVFSAKTPVEGTKYYIVDNAAFLRSDLKRV